jgi:ABC-type antimicrobial peptide transport system permease subunit
MFFTGSITETISYAHYEELLLDNRVNVAVPFAMGDNFNGSKIIGTTPEFLAKKELDKGEMFGDKFEAVVGYEVARANGLKIGDKLVTSHGVSEGGHNHENHPLVVVGILEKTNTAYDNVIFTRVETLWATHGHADEDDLGGEHEGEHEHGDICAILIKCKTPGYIDAIQSKYKGDSSLLVITPMEVMREVLANIDTSVYIVYVLCVIILIMNICIISVITLLNMYDSKKEIALMRLIGIGMNKINLLYIIQNGFIGVISTALAFGVSRLCLILVRGYVSSMGIVLNVARVYPLEWVIMVVVAVISVLPTVVCTLNMSKKDGISE